MAAEAPTPDASGYPLVYRNLMAVGLLGAVYRARDDADTVSAAVELTLDDPTPFRVCRAIAHSIGGDAEYASSTLGQHVEAHPDDEGAKVALATAFLLARDARWKGILDEILATSADQNVRQAANGVLAYAATLQ
ncbi:hypothetical protein [Roseateles amylovorans]|uniref:HEAT repeat domain-containing protein n=1 Tax=Roseateles amylovorans TaxID=2978473 RepID=A0ABY6AZE2_9BURK|nr:hypothetical protein [Roseateles amylovorans]UXH78278.1 hypothetical protein N4261_25575 [Roseateles amylovorans]